MSIDEIRKAFGGRLVGNDYMQQMVCLAVSKLHKDLVEHVTKHVWFFSSDEDALGFAFDGNDLKDKHMIFLADVLFREDQSQVLYTILHEIGHVELKHKNSIGVKQTKEEIDKQEKEADQFVDKYLDKT